MPFVRVYFRETPELVFDAHDKAFQFYAGAAWEGRARDMTESHQRVTRSFLGVFSWGAEELHDRLAAARKRGEDGRRTGHLLCG
jgi:hypothetical protein